MDIEIAEGNWSNRCTALGNLAVACVDAEALFILKGIPAVFHHYLGKLAVEIVAADSESGGIGQDIYAIEDKDPLLKSITQSVKTFSIVPGRNAI